MTLTKEYFDYEHITVSGNIVRIPITVYNRYALYDPTTDKFSAFLWNGTPLLHKISAADRAELVSECKKAIETQQGYIPMG